jgi:hypothetical protein
MHAITPAAILAVQPKRLEALKEGYFSPVRAYRGDVIGIKYNYVYNPTRSLPKFLKHSRL